MKIHIIIKVSQSFLSFFTGTNLHPLNGVTSRTSRCHPPPITMSLNMMSTISFPPSSLETPLPRYCYVSNGKGKGKGRALLTSHHRQDTMQDSTHQVEGRLLLNIVITESTAIFQLLPGEDETLLVRGDPFLVLNLLLHILNSIGRLHIQGDSLALRRGGRQRRQWRVMVK